MFDTHTHLNFKAYKKTLNEVIMTMKEVGVTYGVIPGTDIKTSISAVRIAEENDGLWAAVGIHPHHAYELDSATMQHELQQLENILHTSKVVAIGEVGIDRHQYQETRYNSYSVSKSFVNLQEQLFRLQIQMAVKYKKSLIIHNREAKTETLRILTEEWSDVLQHRSVFHCCEPDEELLAFAIKHKMYIGVDGDVTYEGSIKPAFLTTVPTESLVLETDSPFLLPEPLRSERKYPNTPSNLPLIAQAVAQSWGQSVQNVVEITTKNALRLFNLSA